MGTLSYGEIPQYWNIEKRLPNGVITYIPLPPEKEKLYEDSKDAGRQDYYFSALSSLFLVFTLFLIIMSYIICYFLFYHKIGFINKVFLFLIIVWIVLLVCIINYSYYLFNKSKNLGMRVKKEIGI